MKKEKWEEERKEKETKTELKHDKPVCGFTIILCPVVLFIFMPILMSLPYFFGVQTAVATKKNE